LSNNELFNNFPVLKFMDQNGKVPNVLKPRILEPKTPMSRTTFSTEKPQSAYPHTPFSKTQYSDKATREWEDIPLGKVPPKESPSQQVPETNPLAQFILDSWAPGKSRIPTPLNLNDLLEDGRTKYIYKLETGHQVVRIFVKSKLALSQKDNLEKPVLSFETLDKFLNCLAKFREGP
jgi:hypothetical protein